MAGEGLLSVSMDSRNMVYGAELFRADQQLMLGDPQAGEFRDEPTMVRVAKRT